MAIRSSRCKSQPRVWKKTWSQGVRDITQTSRRSTQYLSHHSSCRTPQRKHSINSYYDSQPATDSEYSKEDLATSAIQHGCFNNNKQYISNKYYSPATGVNCSAHRSTTAGGGRRRRKNSLRTRRAVEEVYGDSWACHNASAYERCCDQLSRGRLRSKKQKYRLHEERGPMQEGRYRKRSCEYLITDHRRRKNSNCCNVNELPRAVLSRSS